MKDIAQEPVSKVIWRDRSELKPNDYNPNHVAKPELELLIISIVEDGWTQPIVVLPDLTIVDGFHRYTVSADKRLTEKYGTQVPTVMIDIDPVHRKMSTIRHNRARGTHGIMPMAHIVEYMVKEGVSREQIMERLQMEREEVDRLLSRIGSPIKNSAADYGKSWKPIK
jgi:ParB-like chromosome segregation protein Spo0J